MMTLANTVGTRQAVIEACLWLGRAGLNQGTSGNVSVRVEEGVLITPSGIPYETMTPNMLQIIPHEGAPDPDTPVKPSTEWRFHQSVLAARPDMVAVVHAHPIHATAVAIQRKPIPACHYMVAAFGGNDVPLVDYNLFGNTALAQGVADAMAERTGCLLANHGAVTAGETIAKALWRFQELETLAQMYLAANIGGTPMILSDDEMAQVHDAFADYGPKAGSTDADA